VTEPVTLSQAELEVLLQQAAKRGAQEALSKLGLHDDEAGHDIRELRQLIDSWREVKLTATKTLVKWLMMGIIGIISLGAYFNFKP